MFVNKRQKIPQPKRAEPARRGLPVGRKAAESSGAIYKSEENKKPLDWDDISLSSEDSKSFERFLKKKSDNGSTKIPKKDKPAKVTSYERPKTSRGAIDKLSSVAKPQLSSSNALNRLALIEARIKNRQEVHSRNKMSMSSSDFDLDISSDSEVKRQMGKLDMKLREKIRKSSGEKRPSQEEWGIFLTLDDGSETSEDSASRQRFLKSNNSKIPVRDSRGSSEESGSERLSFIKNGKDQQMVKVHASTDLDESEASFPPYTKSVDKDKESKRSASSKKVTFASDLVRSSDLEQSLDEFMPSSYKSDDPSSLDEVIPSKLHNIMSLDDLVPSQEFDLNGAEGDERPASALGFIGLHSADELLPADTEVRSSSEYVPSLEEDIQEASPRSSDRSSSEGQLNVLQNLRSVDDLEVSEEEPKPMQSKPQAVTIFKAQKAVESESEEIKSESLNYTEDFHSDDDTLKGTESINQDVSEASYSASSVPEEDAHSEDFVRDRRDSFSSSIASSVESSSSLSTRSPSPARRKSKRKVEAAEVQTDVAAGTWMPGSVFADAPSFKPSRLIDNEALDVLTSYNPANLAIHDLLQQQVTLTREFVTRSRRLHELAVSTIPCDYVYGEINAESLERLKRIWYNQDDTAVSTT